MRDFGEQKYDELGGVYFPVLQQDGTRVLTKIRQGNDMQDLMFLQFLRKSDRPSAKESE